MDTLLYIMYHPQYHAIKVGISDISGRRYKAHKTKGWVLVAYWHFFERDQAKAIESIVLKTLREKHGIYLDKTHMPQSGYTETFNASKISKRSLVRMVNKAIRQQHSA